MKLFPLDDDAILYETCFGDDTFGRKEISKQLSDLVERIESPLVIALDDSWGQGKSYFLKRWVAAHTKDNGGTATTVYFDAFENDYLADPLVSLVAAVTARMPKGQKSKVAKIKRTATKLLKPAFGIALSLATFGPRKNWVRWAMPSWTPQARKPKTSQQTCGRRKRIAARQWRPFVDFCPK